MCRGMRGTCSRKKWLPQVQHLPLNMVRKTVPRGRALARLIVTPRRGRPANAVEQRGSPRPRIHWPASFARWPGLSPRSSPSASCSSSSKRIRITGSSPRFAPSPTISSGHSRGCSRLTLPEQASPRIGASQQLSMCWQASWSLDSSPRSEHLDYAPAAAPRLTDARRRPAAARRRRHARRQAFATSAALREKAEALPGEGLPQMTHSRRCSAKSASA